MKPIRVFFLYLLFASVTAFTQSFTVEQIMSSPFPTQLTSARSADIVAWVFNTKGADNVWIAAAPDYVGRQVTRYAGDDGQRIASLKVTPDGRTILYARGSELNGGGRSANPLTLPAQPKQQVWAADVEKGEPRLLGDMGCEEEGCEDIQVSPDGKYAIWETKHQLWIAGITGPRGATAKQLTDIRGDISWPQWSPDGKRVAFRVDRRSHSFVVIADLVSNLDQALTSSESSEGSKRDAERKKDQPPLLSAVHYISPSADRDLFPRWSSDGKQIAFIRTAGQEDKLPLIPVRPRPWSLWIGDTTNYSARQIWSSGANPRDSLPPFAGESLQFAGDRVAFVSEQTNRNHLYSIPVSGGQATELTPGDFDVEDVTPNPDGRSFIVYSSNQDDVDRRHIWTVDAKGGASPKALTKGDTIEWAPTTTSADRVFCLGSTATTPALPYRIGASGRDLIAKDALPKDFPAQLVVPRQVTFKSSDGLTIHGQLFVPKNQTGRGPALIFTHGGPSRQMLLGFHYMYYYHNAYAENQFLANLGYTVLSVNYRLGIMYGHDFRQPSNAGWRGASEYNDVLAGVHYLESLANVDPQRIGLWGGSYGGFLTAMGLARNSDIFKAGVDFHGVHDWSQLLPQRPRIFSDEAPDAKEALQLAFSSSPDASVDKWRSPVLLIHGDDDRNVPFNQTVDLVQRLKKQGVEYEEIIYPDEIHDLLLWKDWVNSYKAAGRFFDQKLKGQK